MKRLFLPIWLLALSASAWCAWCAISILLDFLRISRIPGPTGPSAGIALIFSFALFVVSALLIAACLRFRPPREVITKTNITCSVALVALVFATFNWSASRKYHQYILELQLLDDRGAPLPSATLFFTSITSGKGRAFSRVPNKSARITTDTNGILSVTANRVQTLSFTPEVAGFEDAHIEVSDLRGDASHNNHKLTIHRASLQYPPNAQHIDEDAESDRQRCQIPPSQTVRVTAKLRKLDPFDPSMPSLNTNKPIVTATARSALKHDGAEYRLNLDFANHHLPVALAIRSWTDDRTDNKPMPDWRVELSSTNARFQLPPYAAETHLGETRHTNCLSWHAISTNRNWTADFDKMIHFKTDQGFEGGMHIKFLTWGDSLRVDYWLCPPTTTH